MIPLLGGRFKKKPMVLTSWNGGAYERAGGFETGAFSTAGSAMRTHNRMIAAEGLASRAGSAVGVSREVVSCEPGGRNIRNVGHLDLIDEGCVRVEQRTSNRTVRWTSQNGREGSRNAARELVSLMNGTSLVFQLSEQVGVRYVQMITYPKHDASEAFQANASTTESVITPTRSCTPSEVSCISLGAKILPASGENFVNTEARVLERCRGSEDVKK